MNVGKFTWRYLLISLSLTIGYALPFFLSIMTGLAWLTWVGVGIIWLVVIIQFIALSSVMGSASEEYVEYVEYYRNLLKGGIRHPVVIIEQIFCVAFVVFMLICAGAYITIVPWIVSHMLDEIFHYSMRGSIKRLDQRRRDATKFSLGFQPKDA